MAKEKQETIVVKEPEKLKINLEKEEASHLITPVEEEEVVLAKPVVTTDVSNWKPKTELGKKVKAGTITDIDEVLSSDKKMLEVEIVDALLPSLESDLLLVGQSKGKFGGGQRRVFRQTQKKTMEGNKPSFATCAIIGDRNGHIGLGYGKSRETVPAREKAIRKAKLNIMKIRRGCGSWQCNCKDAHSIPFEVEGRCGSLRVKLMPAPKGTGLCAAGEVAKILSMAGIKDIWSKHSGNTTSRINFILAVMDALRKLMEMKVQQRFKKTLNIAE